VSYFDHREGGEVKIFGSYNNKQTNKATKPKRQCPLHTKRRKKESERPSRQEPAGHLVTVRHSNVFLNYWKWFTVWRPWSVKQNQNHMVGGQRDQIGGSDQKSDNCNMQTTRNRCAGLSFFHLRTSGTNFTLLAGPVAHKDTGRSWIFRGSEFRTYQNLISQENGWHGRSMARYSSDDPYYRLGHIHTCFYVRACRLVMGTTSYVPWNGRERRLVTVDFTEGCSSEGDPRVSRVY